MDTQRLGVNGTNVIANPSITFRGDCVLVQTNATVLAENTALGLGCTTYGRFWDRVEKRAGAWKIVRRQSCYDTGHFTFVTRTPASTRPRSGSTPASTPPWCTACRA